MGKSFLKRCEEMKEKLQMKSKKGQSMNPLIAGIIGFAIVVLVLAAVGIVLSSFQSGQTVDTIAYNVTRDGLKGTNSISSQVPTIAIILVAVFIIGLVIAGFAFRNKQ